ncbi:MarR family winged helix-turn-helix transcriptional regulator [Martelella alba]|uniref:MarR family transcriptional regulator n=1 Tax=Martelella alba TaxID=2590451 RepID=A0ABY2SKF4_9HYPH|nr:MarR family transcriptional regulator [Martelella alba]TKI03783.1 MarR family transcriptional regulator [Martelella alba]
MQDKSLQHDVTELMHAIGLLVRRARNESHAGGLSMTESMVMSRLANDGPATTAALARAEGIKPQSMGAIIASLEKSGYVQRTPHATDGRLRLVALTTEGTALRQRNREAKQLWLSRAIAGLSPQERDTLFTSAGIIQRLAEQTTE